MVGADGTPSSQLWIASEVAVSLERKAITLGDRLRKMLSDAFPGRCFAVAPRLLLIKATKSGRNREI